MPQLALNLLVLHLEQTEQMLALLELVRPVLEQVLALLEQVLALLVLLLQAGLMKGELLVQAGLMKHPVLEVCFAFCACTWCA